jgi:hypothetical protein
MPHKGRYNEPAALALNHEAVEHFEDAARKVRERFRSSVLEALPGFARRLFEREWQEVADLESIEAIPPLTVAYLTICERCVCDLLNKNHEGVASDHFEKCVGEAADVIRAKVIVSSSYAGNDKNFKKVRGIADRRFPLFIVDNGTAPHNS